MKRDNLVLIGMPGAGKSTAGVLAAKRLALPFVDTDVLLQAQEGRTLSALLTVHGHAGFRAIESRFILGHSWTGTVIATGGSVVYSPETMEHLLDSGFVVYLYAKPEVLEQRLGDLDARGVVREPGQRIEDLYVERHPLYIRYAHETLECGTWPLDEVAAAVADAYENR